MVAMIPLHPPHKKRKTDKTLRRSYLGELDFRSTETTLFMKMFSLCCHQTRCDWGGYSVGDTGTGRETDREADK